MADAAPDAESQLDARIKSLNHLPDSDPEKYAQLTEAYKALETLHHDRREKYLDQVEKGRKVPIADPAHPRFSTEEENRRQATQIARADSAEEPASPAERQAAISDLVTPEDVTQQPDEQNTPEAEANDHPTLPEFLAKAGPVNPEYSTQELTDWYEQLYGPKEPTHPHLPTLEEFLPKAQEVNPDYSKDELTDWWKDLYGSRGAKEHNPGFFDTLIEGVKGTGRNLKAYGQALVGNNEGVVETANASAQAPRAQELEDFLQGVSARKQALGPDASWADLSKAFAQEFLNNPKGAALLGVEQLGNIAAVGGTTGAGAITGSVFGPPGALIGGIAGLFLGEIGLETGSKAIDKAADQSFTEAERGEALKQGAIKGSITAGIDLATFGATKWLMGTATRAMEAATARTLTNEGVDIADRAAVRAAAKTPAIAEKVHAAQLAAAKGVNTLAKRTMRGGAEVGLEMLGEGTGEYIGEEAATGKGDKMEALIEAFTSLGQSAGEMTLAGAMSRHERGALTQPAGSTEPPQPPPQPEDVAKTVMGGSSLEDALKRANEEIDKPVSPDDLDAAIRRQGGEEPPGPPPTGGSTPPSTPPNIPSIQDLKEAYTDSHYAADKVALDRLLAGSDKTYRAKNGDWYVRRKDGTGVRMDVVRPDTLPETDEGYSRPELRVRKRGGTLTPYTEAGTRAVTKSDYEALRFALGAQGKRLILVTPNSRFDGVTWQSQLPNTVFLATRTTFDPVSVAFHEVGHLMQRVEPLYDVFQELVRENLTPEARVLANARHNREKKLNEDQVFNEITADIAGDAMTRPDFMQKVFARLQERLGEQQAHTLAQQFLDAIKTMMNRILSAAVGHRFRTKDGYNIVEQYVTNLEKIHDALSHAVAEQYYRQGQVKTSKEPAPGIQQSVIRTNEERVIPHPETVKTFEATANATPHDATINVQKAIGGGVLYPVVEHAGDLLHTMTQKVREGSALQPLVQEKLDRVLGALTHGYGFEKELRANIRANANYLKTTPGQLQLKVNEALNQYAQAHAKQKVYNLPQWLAKHAAVAIGRREFDKAVTYLKQLKALADSEEFTQMAFAHERNELGKLKEYLRPIASALISTTPNGRTIVRDEAKQAYHLMEDVDHLLAGTKATQAELNTLGYKAVPEDLISREEHQERVKTIEGKETKAEKAARQEKEKALTTAREQPVESAAESEEAAVPEHAPAFYSHMIKTLEAKMPNKASADQIRAILSPKNGVKPEEMKYTGMEAFLATKEIFTKHEVLDFARENELKLNEIMKGDGRRPTSAERAALVDWARTTDKIGPQINRQVFVDEIRKVMDSEAEGTRSPRQTLADLEGLGIPDDLIQPFRTYSGIGNRATKYAEPTLNLPGGKDYRELLFQLPIKNSPNNWKTVLNKTETEYAGREMRDVVDTAGRVRATLPAEEVGAYLRQEAELSPKGGTFHGGHWDTPNVLAHTRFDTREIDGKKTLFIQEIQSDWHQKGRKQGYREDAVSARRMTPDENYTDSWFEILDRNGKVIATQIADTEQEALSIFREKSSIPDAPFKKTWQEYVLRRMIRYAAEHGFKQIGWTTGDQQNARYDLSKHIDSVRYTPDTYRLEAFKDGDRVVDQENVPPDKIADYIGKEAAERLLNTEKVRDPSRQFPMHRLDGEDLKVGGSGMVGFYDKILVDYANKLGKPFGTKVENVKAEVPEKGVSSFGKEVSLPMKATIHALPIPTAMRNAVLNEGQPTFSPAEAGDEENLTESPETNPRSYRPWTVDLPGKLDYIIRKLQHRGIDIQRIVEAIQKAGNTIPSSLNAIFKEEMYQKRAQQRSEDYTQQELKPLLEQMEKTGITQDELDKYLHAKHVLDDDVNARLKDLNPTMPDNEALSGMSDEEARSFMTSLTPERMALLEKLTDTGVPTGRVNKQGAPIMVSVKSMIEKTRDLMVDYGLESEERIAQWRYLYKFYVPLRRDEFDEAGHPTGTGRSVRGSTASPRLGSKLGVSPILANVAQARDQIITRGEKMRPVVAMAGLLMMYPNAEIASLDKYAEIEMIDPETGLPMTVPGDLTGYKVPMLRRLNPRTGKAELYPDPLYKGRKNVVNFRIKGQDYAIVFNEKNERALEAAKAFREEDSGKLNAVMQAIAPWTRYLASINTQYNPIFGIVNFVRDAQFASLALASTPLAGKQMQILNNARKSLVGIFQDARDARHGLPPSSATAQLWERFQHVGGPTGYRDLFFTARDRQAEIERLLNPNTWRNIRSPQDLGRRLEDTGLFRLLSDYNLTMENAIRLGVFKTGIEMGLSDLEAASHAKNITVNFNKRGQIGAQMGSLYAFFNANVQGTARILETLFERTPDGGVTLTSGGKKIIAGGILLGVLQTAMLALGGFGGDEPPEYVKNRNLVIPAPGTDKGYVMIPLPLGFNLLPNIGRLASEVVRNGFEGRPLDIMKKGFDLFSAMIGTLSPTGGSGSITQEVMPTVLDPLASLEANKDWTGKSISKEDLSSQKPTPGHARAHDTATPWALALSKAINWATGGSEYTPGVLSPTPDAIDFVIEQATGGVGREISKAAQVAKSAYSGEEVPPYKVPLFGRFFGSSTGAAAIRSHFYDNVKAANIAMEEIKGRAEHKEELQSYLKTHPEARFAHAAEQFQRGIGDLQKAKKLAIDKGEKERVRMFEDKITGLMKRFNDRIDEARKLH